MNGGLNRPGGIGADLLDAACTAFTYGMNGAAPGTVVIMMLAGGGRRG